MTIEGQKKGDRVDKSSPSSRFIHIPTLLFSVFTVYMLYAGWQIRDYKYITSKSGLGYWLGIVGSVIMLLLFLYLARKKLKFMHNWGKTKTWFQVHMIMGILGPLLVLFHCNFHLGSLNSRVALFSTLFVAASGIVGRYIYTRLHQSLYGKEIEFSKLIMQRDDNDNSLNALFTYAPDIREYLQKYDKLVRTHRDYGFLRSLLHLLHLEVWVRYLHFTIVRKTKRTLDAIAEQAGLSAKERRLKKREALSIINAHMAIVLSIAEFNFYKRLSGLWHLLHLPLFIFLVIVVVVHIVVVNMY